MVSNENILSHNHIAGNTGTGADKRPKSESARQRSLHQFRSFEIAEPFIECNKKAILVGAHIVEQGKIKLIILSLADFKAL
ncbi:hypothetical protein SAMN05421547_12352 [Delftia lacustris]|uniref:Uncharacterized protein n=1 Tax=Delftia lacustris TaxID=558537 RepID=A0A1H3SW59_9BURK|nr:hypothetical protein SAMN05421547_12352 [Delftia lacustris]